MSLAPGLVVCAPHSGAGKTSVTLGLLRAFARDGIDVAGAKCGPDYIDPAFHQAASGRRSLNLDGYAMPPPLLRGLAAHAATGVALVIAEGPMGLFDGATSAERSGASAEVARLLGWPMLLVVDASGAAQSVAAVALGCARHPRAPRLAGVIVNRIASARHGRLVEQGLAELDLPLLGMIAADPALGLPARHLGLVQAAELPDLTARLDRLADAVGGQCNLPAIRAAAGATATASLPPHAVRQPGQRIAVARDAAFGFFYPHVAAAWRQAGADLIFFSPLADEPPAADADACWLPGGYPELHAGRLGGNRRFLDGLRGFAASRPVHGECGGYMVLGHGLVDATGQRHEMAGLLPIATSFALRRRTLGYREATLRADCMLGAAGTGFRGHEYHYATLIEEVGPSLFDLIDGEETSIGGAGHANGQVSGSFFHLIA